MSDCRAAAIEIGGTIKRHDLPEFTRLLEGAYDSPSIADDSPEDVPKYLVDVANNKATVSVADAEAGSFDEIETACQKFGLSYIFNAEAKYDPEYIAYFDGTTLHEANAIDSQVAISIRELKELVHKDGSLDKLFARFAIFEQPLPPFAIEPEA